VHFTLHGCHHKFPLDRGRLVFPPLPAAMCALGLRAACRAALPPVRVCVAAIFIGLIGSNFCYLSEMCCGAMSFGSICLTWSSSHWQTGDVP